MPFDWKTALLGPPRGGGHTVELLEVTPHGGDLHLVAAAVDGKPFRNYVPTGDIRGEEPHVQRRVIASRVLAMTSEPKREPALTGKEVGLP